MTHRKKVVVGAYVGKDICAKLDSLAAKFELSRSEAAGYCLEMVLKKPGIIDEFVRQEAEKKERLIRYIM